MPSTSLCTLLDWNTTDSITPSKLPVSPQYRRHGFLHNIEQEYHHLLLPLQNSQSTRTHMELSLFLTLTGQKVSFLHLVKFYAVLRLPWIRGWGGRAAAQRDEPPHDRG